jgi:hypothetical protein
MPMSFPYDHGDDHSSRIDTRGGFDVHNFVSLRPPLEPPDPRFASPFEKNVGRLTDE